MATRTMSARVMVVVVAGRVVGAVALVLVGGQVVAQAVAVAPNAAMERARDASAIVVEGEEV